MAIKARNIIVGGKSLPTTKKEPEKLSLSPEPTKVLRTVVEDEPSRYVEKKDGELIRNINTKSHYLKDMVDFEN